MGYLGEFPRASEPVSTAVFHRIIVGIKGVMDTKVLSEHKRLCNMAIVSIPFKRWGGIKEKIVERW